MILQHNMSAMNAARQYKCTTKNSAKRAERLSSGYKINRAADDAAGLTISEGMRSMIRGLKKASKNAQDGVSLLQTAEGALNESQNIVQRIRELAVQAANDTNNTEDRAAIEAEIDALLMEVDHIAEDTEFNTIKLLDGTLEETFVTNPIQQGNVSRSNLEQYTGNISVDSIIGSGVASGITTTQLDNLNDTLVNSIIPQATNAFLNTFSAFNTAAAAGQVSSNIGLMLYGDSSTTLAYVAMSYGSYSDGTIAADTIELNLSVNVNSLVFSGDDLSDDSRRALETTIVHEMMHAFMDDTLTNGMIGATNGVIDSSNEFTGWFTEGMAQVAAGGCSNDNDWVNGGLGLTASSTQAEITAAVQNAGNALSSDTTEARYGTGYLACMYLGYLAAGSPSSINSGNLASGVNEILEGLMNGNSLDNIINEISGGAYISVSDFENKFGDSASADFISRLLNAVGSTGNGGLVSTLTDADLLDDGNTSAPVYNADDTQEFVTSSVGTNRDWGTGGTSQTGTNYTGGSSGGTTGGGTGGTGTSGSAPLGALQLQIGALGGQSMTVSIEDMHVTKLGIANISVMSHERASRALLACDNALEKISAERAKIGACVNRLEHTIANLDNTAENTQAAESRIRDANMVEEMVEFSKDNILAQVGQSMLAQANQNPQGVLSLLQ